MQDAVIVDLKIFSDCLYPSLIDDLTALLKGKSFTIRTIEEIMPELKMKYADISAGLSELERWLSSQVEI